MEIEEEEFGIPEWVVTFGDMMSLLLTFFIMLLSMSEMKKDEQYQAVMESIRKKFGHDMSSASMVPGKLRPRNSKLDKLASMGRSMRQNIMRGGNPVDAPTGDHSKVQIVRGGELTNIGGAIYFDKFSTELTLQAKVTLKKINEKIGGKPHKIAIRVHTTRQTPPTGTLMQLSFQRAEVVIRYLKDDLNINPQRFVPMLIGPNEPIHTGTDVIELKKNSRVEIFLLNKTVDQYKSSTNNTENARGP